MSKQINLSHLQQNDERIKAYIDGQANAQVIRTETTLWSGTGRTGQTLTLSSSIQNYDEIIIYAVKDNSEDVYRQWQAATVKVSDIVLGKGVIFYIPSGNPANDWARITFSTNTSVAVTTTTPSSASYNTITKITGIKYTVPETYSLNEQIVGKWIDGRPVYLRAFTGNMPAIEKGDYAQINTTLNPDVLVDSGGSMTVKNNDGVSVVRMLGQTVAYRAAGGTIDATWRSSVVRNRQNIVAFLFDSPDGTVGDYTTDSDTYSFWIKYVKAV